MVAAVPNRVGASSGLRCGGYQSPCMSGTASRTAGSIASWAVTAPVHRLLMAGLIASEKIWLAFLS